MKRTWRFLLLLAAAVALLAVTALAADGDVSFSTVASDDGLVVNGITVEGDEAVDVTIPAQIEGKTVVSVNLQDMSAEDAAKIKTLTIAGEDVTILGNLFKWQNHQYSSVDLETETSYSVPVPNTAMLLDNIPAFIKEHYENGAYYMGKNLVRVDPNYSGNLVVKKGTVSILASAMEGCTKLKAVTLPDSVEWIGVRAFCNSSVTSVNLPAGLLTDGKREIQMETFYGCKNLKSVTFPAGTSKLKTIKLLAFYDCSSLNGFDFTRTETLETMAFAKAFKAGTAIDLSQTMILDWASTPAVFSHSGVGSVTFGSSENGTKIITCEMFRGCTSLKTVKLGSVEKIGPWAFSNCTSLKQDILADSKVTNICYRAFANVAMTEVTIPALVQELQGGIFAGNEQLTTLNWRMVQQYNRPLFSILNDYSKSGHSFDYIYKMPNSADVPEEHTYIKTLNIYKWQTSTGPSNTLFAFQPYLETVHVRCETTEIGPFQFQLCPNLKSITFSAPEKIKSIGSSAFTGCLSLTSFPFEKMTSLERIEDNAFLLATGGAIDLDNYRIFSAEQKTFGLTEVDLSACTQLRTLGYAAFYNQYNVKKVHLPASLNANASNGYLNGMANLKELICEGDVPNRMFASMVFSEDSSGGYHGSLEKVTIKGQIQVLDYSKETPTFYRMSKLKEVNLPNATSIPDKCFVGCEALETVNAPKVESVGEFAFYRSGLTNAVISKDVTYGAYAFAECKKLKTVVVEEGVEALQILMFVDCTGLEQVSLPSTLKTINWGAFKHVPAGAVNIPTGVTVIEDDAFSGGSKKLIFRGAPAVELEYNGPEYSGGGEPDLLPIDGTASIYYADSAAKASAELYKDSAGEDAEQLTILSLPTEAQMVITGAPSSVRAGQKLNTKDLKVTCAGVVLTEDQYTLDYDPGDKTLGERAVTLTVTDTSVLPLALLETTVHAVGLSGETVSGKVYAVTDGAQKITSSFTVNVKNNSSSGGIVNVNYSIAVAKTENGSAETSAYSAAQGKTIKITTAPDKGYVLDTLTVVNQNGVEQAVTEQGDGIYTFTMPASNVTVQASFRKKDAGPKEMPFTDVSGDAYYADAVLWAVENGITQGTSSSTFSPEVVCTRSQAVAFLWRAAGCPAPKSSEMPFTDVPGDAYYADAVLWAVENGITKGTSSSTFSPEVVCTRAQIMTLLWRAAGCPAPESSEMPFTDVSEDAYYANAVLWAVEQGITKGTGGMAFQPDADCTRAQIVALLWRADTAE